MPFCNVTQYCTNLASGRSPARPNSDISGIGVLTAFVVPAILTFILLLLHYLFVYDPTQEDAKEGRNKFPNPIDELMIGLLSKKLTRASSRWRGTLETMILTLCDQQLVTGIAIVASAIAQLQNAISTYHWQIVIYLAWFSTITHLATLAILHQRFRSNKVLLAWRLASMIALFALIVFSLIPTASNGWLHSGGIPACCYYPHHAQFPESLLSSESTAGTTVVSIVILTLSFAQRIIKLCITSNKFTAKIGKFVHSLTWPSFNALHKASSAGHSAARWLFYIPYLAILSISLITKSWFYLAGSRLLEILWLLIALVWGALRLYLARTDYSSDVIEEENSWGFGQCLSVALLALLLFSFVDAYFDKTQENSIEILCTGPSVHAKRTVLGESHYSPTSNPQQVEETLPTDNHTSVVHLDLEDPQSIEFHSIPSEQLSHAPQEGTSSLRESLLHLMVENSRESHFRGQPSATVAKPPHEMDPSMVPGFRRLILLNVVFVLAIASLVLFLLIYPIYDQLLWRLTYFLLFTSLLGIIPITLLWVVPMIYLETVSTRNLCVRKNRNKRKSVFIHVWFILLLCGSVASVYYPLGMHLDAFVGWQWAGIYIVAPITAVSVIWGLSLWIYFRSRNKKEQESTA